MPTRKMNAIDEIIAERKERGAKYKHMVRETARLLGGKHPKKHGSWFELTHVTKYGDELFLAWDDYGANMHIDWKYRAAGRATRVFTVHRGTLKGFIPGPWEPVLLGVFQARVVPLLAEEKVRKQESEEQEKMEQWGISENEIKATLAERE